MESSHCEIVLYSEFLEDYDGILCKTSAHFCVARRNTIAFLVRTMYSIVSINNVQWRRVGATSRATNHPLEAGNAQENPVIVFLPKQWALQHF